MGAIAAWVLLAAVVAEVIAAGHRSLAHNRATARNGTILTRPKPATHEWPGGVW